MEVDRNKHILDFFRRSVNAGKLAHGYLFWGPEEEEMKDVAYWLADFLKTNPFDILYIAPEEDRKGISIDQIRKAKKHLSLSPYNSPYKFAIINKAETMNLDACNALLKTLEEPQGNTILILITPKPDFLPKTIISRLQDVRFRPIPLDKLSKDFIQQEYIDILKKPLNDILKFVEKISKNGSEILPVLDSWLFWYRSLMIDSNRYADIVREIIRVKELITTTNVNKRLALENLVLTINKKPKTK